MLPVDTLTMSLFMYFDGFRRADSGEVGRKMFQGNSDSLAKMRLLLVLLAARWLWLRSRRQKQRKTSTAAVAPPCSGPSVRQRVGFAALVGNTKMIRLASLSAATGCEILVIPSFPHSNGMIHCICMV